MYQKDYILRLVEEFMRVAARLAGLRESGQFRQLDEEIRRVYDSVLKTDYTLVTGFDNSSLEQYMNDHQPEEWEMLASLLLIEGESFADRGEQNMAEDRFRKALGLFQKCEDSCKTYSIDRTEKMDRLQKYLEKAG